jgi:hypothetical protein
MVKTLLPACAMQRVWRMMDIAMRRAYFISLFEIPYRSETVFVPSIVQQEIGHNGCRCRIFVFQYFTVPTTSDIVS